jgi:hypothetical protein
MYWYEPVGMIGVAAGVVAYVLQQRGRIGRLGWADGAGCCLRVVCYLSAIESHRGNGC